MKRTSMIAAAMGAAAVLGLAGTAVAANAGTSVPATVKVSPVGDDNGLRGDGTVDDNKSKTAPSAPASASYDRGEASAAALKATGGGKVTKIEAEYEHGRAVWKVRIVKDGKRHDLYVDRKSGKVTRHDVKKSSSSSKKATSTRTVAYTIPKPQATKKHSDDHRGRGRGSDDKGRDDKGGDDHGRGGHGKDDKGSDDHGGHGRGSDD
jgi:uncharacterized membrane protein YkoI